MNFLLAMLVKVCVSMLEVMHTYRGHVLLEPAIIFLFILFFFLASPSLQKATIAVIQSEMVCSCEYQAGQGLQGHIGQALLS